MNTSQIQIGDTYNDMPAFLKADINSEFLQQRNSFVDEIKNKGPIRLRFSDTFLKAYIFTAEIESNDIVLKYADKKSGLDFKIKLSINEDGSGGTVSLVTSEPTIQAGILSTRLWYLFISNKCPVILLKDGKAYNLTVNSYSEEQRKKLFYRAKVFRKLQFIEECLKDKLKDKLVLPRTISSNDIALIDTIFRGITRGKVDTLGTSFSTKKYPPFDIDPHKFISVPPRAYAISLNTMSLFDCDLSVGKIDVIFPYATASLQEEKDGAIELTFRPLNEQIKFHFSEYSNNLAEYYDKLESFKKKLAIEEPQELVELTTEPLLGDVSSVEASEIAVGWLLAQIRNVPCPAIKVERSEINKLGKCWKIDILLENNNLGESIITSRAFRLSLYVERLTGKIINPIAVTDIEKAIINLYLIEDKREQQPPKPSNGKMLVEALAKAGLIGMWKNRTDITNSLEFARKLRTEAEVRGKN